VELESVLRQRRTVRHFDPNFEISDDQLAKLFEQVALTPSSYNLQHWRFVVVRDAERRKALAKAAFNQPWVSQASAVVAVLGKLNAHVDAPRIFSAAPKDVQARLLPEIQATYAQHPTEQREEAITGAALATMTLLLVATDMGLATCPVGAFDRKQVRELLGVDDKHIVTMLIALGKQAGQLHVQGHRWPPSEIVRLERWDGEGLK
jgi:nitroreductase